MKVTKRNLGEVMQRIYDSEIHLQVGWLWDGGIEYRYKITNPYIWENINSDDIVGGNDDVVDTFRSIAEDLCREYPNSAFARWFTKKWYQFWK